MEEKFEKVIKLFKEKTAKECYKIEVIEEEPSIMDDKIGGTPYLPIGEEYPKDKDGNFLALLLQVNLKNIDLLGYPKKGILEIFTDVNVDYPCQYAIKYFDEGLEYQTDFPNIDVSRYITDKSYKINLSKDTCYMSLSDYRFIDLFTSIINEVYETKLKSYRDLDDFFGNFAWYDKLRDNCESPLITLGGYADFTQNDPRYDMKENKDECLFKLDSWGSSRKFKIGDVGILSVIISQKDIEECNFSNGIVDWDCT